MILYVCVCLFHVCLSVSDYVLVFVCVCVFVHVCSLHARVLVCLYVFVCRLCVCV